MAGLARTCALVLVSAAGVVTACGHLPFDDLPAGEQALESDSGLLPDGGKPNPNDLDGAVTRDADRPDVDKPLRDGGPDDGAIVDAGCPDCAQIFVSTGVGDDSNPGTPEMPLKTIQKAIDLADATRTQVLVAGGTYVETIKITKRVSIAGAYVCDKNKCDWTKTPDTKNGPTIIQSANNFGGTVLVPDTVKNDTVLSNLEIRGQDGQLPTGTVSGGIAVALLGGTPTLQNLVIKGGNTTKGVATVDNRRSIGLYVSGRASGNESAIIQNCTISGGPSDTASVGVWLGQSQGLQNSGPAVVTIEGSTITAATAPTSQAVVANTSSHTSTIESSTITSSPSNGATEQASWGVVITSSLTLRRNRINIDIVQSTYCNGGAKAPCGGITTTNASATTIESNIIGGVAAQASVGVYLTATANVGSDVAVVGNDITARGLGAAATGTFSAAIALKVASSAATTLGVIRNNILQASQDSANETTYGVYEFDDPTAKGHAKALTNNDFWNVQFVYRSWDGTTALPINSSQIGVNPLLDATNIAKDPLLTNDWHLKDGSPCIGAGTGTNVTGTDIDDQARPQGTKFNKYDIGADERGD